MVEASTTAHEDATGLLAVGVRGLVLRAFEVEVLGWAPPLLAWGTLSGRNVLATYSAEVLLHTWDVSVSISVGPNWPEPDTTAHLEREALRLQQGRFTGVGCHRVADT